jgi:dTDP-4-dehydrorhamnose reductase
VLTIDHFLTVGAHSAVPWGTYHFAGTGVTTWYGFAEAIVDAQAFASRRRPPVEPITTKDYPTPARRPANSELDSDRFAETFGYRAADWKTRMIEAMENLRPN